MGFVGRKVVVLGLGRSGLASARALREGGAEALCWDDGEAGRARAAAEGFTIHDPIRDGLDGVACLVTSPGIPHLYSTPHRAIVAAYAAGVPVDNDIGLFFRSLGQGDWAFHDTPPRVVAVTGSNGKSTTSALIAHILEEAGTPVQLAGNIGRGVLDIEPPIDGEVIVIELSSYQTELARALTPDIAVFTNLSADHLERHGGMGGYFAAKRRLFSEGGPERAVIGVDEIEGQYLAGQLVEGPEDGRLIRVSSGKLSGPGWDVSTRKGWLSEFRKGRQAASIDLRGVPGLPGAHNHQNAACAYGVCRALGLAPRVIEAAFATFEGLPHRSQRVAEINGVFYVNDSKATNVDAATKALGAFKRIRWICGGLEKDGGLEALWEAAGHVAKAYVIGREAEAFALHLGDIPKDVCGDMATAVARASADAQPGDTVLLAPAAASFDQYDSFETRGADFIAQVEKLQS
ncbi:UDP-N-acetylmuramoylalanine--D-glutamate ligase [Jannaschia sp. CCS1]|uniref:UDP-N-acetylmuramoylalanine--D-glutamate ligase n=2 Tax=Jannaschia sp. (strain CCS1) TaxID=290400 RepID=MURD_JANSC|nr:RecName: Full=UDP-N-acetylmuramoylalanine--D-glutamate ligase; AltName: Full=D-glutamic acid-adding enzyme; AltName: Full=UDP-N-acetylmuramoyl-L-alanyl-D-glutamate synthetase [Jannaschia sp. CCS1]ABD55680.1 UDP-N-acetylmuramoylalanine--D-glutamate ligase [Jannaschia sp. CCS1]